VLRIRDVYYPSLIPDPITTKEEEENICCPALFCNHIFQKIILLFNRKKFKPIDTKNYSTFYTNNCHKLSEIWVGDSGSGKKPIPDPRV